MKPLLSKFSSRLTQLEEAGLAPHLVQAQRGIEKESLRIDAAGRLAQTPHPACLGNALTHPSVTTDFSEALLEFITPVCASPEEALQYLGDLHAWTTECLGDELMWSGSMPCELPAESEIPIARYGPSNQGKLKEVYRMGLAWRYGRAMQTIAGIHYNFSPSRQFWDDYANHLGTASAAQADFKSEAYMGLIRNFRRHAWLLLYLFGASPCVAASFPGGKSQGLQKLDNHTRYLPHATALRMSDLGYQSKAQAGLDVCYNTLESYVDSVRKAIATEHAPYREIGIVVDGEYRQLNASILQIENEYYSTIRPKRVTRPGERPLTALANRGIEYIEVRCVDLNPFLPLGLDASETRFLDLFMWFCLLDESPFMDPEECARASGNQTAVVLRGREPGLELDLDGKPTSITEAGTALFSRLADLADLLDQQEGGSPYRDTLAQQRDKLTDATLTPSGQILAVLDEDHMSYAEFGLKMSQQHAEYFRSVRLDESLQPRMQELAEESHKQAALLESEPQGSFEDHLAQYMAN